MNQLRISAKNLGAVALEDFCPRCFWIKLRMENHLPFQFFPGIFASIDAYTKRVIHAQIDAKAFPDWMKGMGEIQGYKKAPHFSKFKVEIPEFGIILTGTPDDIYSLASGGHIIPDYKTAKYTENQDRLLPMYQVQLNGYAAIGAACGFDPVDALYLIYFEPCTDEEYAVDRCALAGFDLTFKARPVKIPIDRDMLNKALGKTRRIFDLQTPPDGRQGCKDCECLSGIVRLAA
jgi:hypothetical protein